MCVCECRMNGWVICRILCGCVGMDVLVRLCVCLCICVVPIDVVLDRVLRVSFCDDSFYLHKRRTRTNKTRTDRQRAASATPHYTYHIHHVFHMGNWRASLGTASRAVPPGPTTDRAGGGVREHGPGAGRIQGLRRFKTYMKERTGRTRQTTETKGKKKAHPL